MAGRASRASMDHFGLRSQGGAKDAKRMVDIATERDRKTAGEAAIAFYAKRNPAINPSVTHLNIDRVNDGAGGFRKMQSIEEGLDYAHARLARVTKEIKAGERKPGAKTRDLREGDGERFLDTIVGHLPWHMCEPDGTYFQPIDPETGRGRVYKRGSKKGQPVMLERYRAKDMEAAIRYFETFVAFQADLLPGGQEAIHGYSIQFDEGRPHIQIQADFLMDDISKKNPEGLKSGYQRAFGAHRHDQKVQLFEDDGTPKLKNGKPVLVGEGGARKMSRYHEELRTYMLELGYDIEAEIDMRRADRRLDHDDYKDMVAAQAEHEDYMAAENEGLGEAVQDHLAEELGEVMPASQSAERALTTEREELAAEREQWEQVEKPALEKAAAAEAREKALVDWGQTEKPELIREAKREGVKQADAALLETVIKLDLLVDEVYGREPDEAKIRGQYERMPLRPGEGLRYVKSRTEMVLGKVERTATEDRQAAAEELRQAEAARQAVARRLAEIEERDEIHRGVLDSLRMPDMDPTTGQYVRDDAGQIAWAPVAAVVAAHEAHLTKARATMQQMAEADATDAPRPSNPGDLGE